MRFFKKGNYRAMITVRVSDAKKEWLSYMAEFYGITLSELLKNYSMEQLEDEYNRQTAEIAHKHWIRSGKTTVFMEESLMNLVGWNDLPFKIHVRNSEAALIGKYVYW
ncbi:TPA: type II toxin-antitoxin system RelB family antitoxin [Enterococcus faecium]